MAKDSQIDPKPVRARKAKGDVPFASDVADNGSRNPKKQSGSRKNVNDDKK